MTPGPPPAVRVPAAVARPLQRSSSAVLSDDGTYRYRLDRLWDARLPRVVWIMLNPSTADASKDDPTIRRCMGFAKFWGCGSMTVVNLFGLRATNPKELWEHEDPWGPLNEPHQRAALLGENIEHRVAAWGGTWQAQHRFQLTAAELAAWAAKHDVPLECLDTTVMGHPVHPLYQAKTKEPRLWRPT